jgi:uncharacterized protein
MTISTLATASAMAGEGVKLRPSTADDTAATAEKMATVTRDVGSKAMIAAVTPIANPKTIALFAQSGQGAAYLYVGRGRELPVP